MHKIVGLVSAAPKKLRRDDDASDRLSHQYTVMILVVFALVITTKQYVGSPITCWAPKHFGGGWIKYTNSYCWVKNTYFLDFDNHIPKEHESEKRHEILYYQWIPFILLMQAALFYAPNIVWRGMNQKSGIDSDTILEAAESLETTQPDRRDKKMLLITNQIDRFVAPRTNSEGMFSRMQGVLSKVCCCVFGSKLGNYLVLLYIFTKCLYILNVVGQLFILTSILQTNFGIFGVDAIQNGMDNVPIVNETVFPKVTMCDFFIRRLGNVQRYTVQCVLPINLYTEFMYVFLWFWMAFVLFMTVMNLVVWIIRAFFGEDRLRFVRGHLKCAAKLNNSTDEILSKDFVFYYLKPDGAFLLRLIAHNTNRVTTTEVIGALWDNWLENRPSRRPSHSSDPETYPLNKLSDSPLPTKPGLDDVDTTPTAPYGGDL